MRKQLVLLSLLFYFKVFHRKKMICFRIQKTSFIKTKQTSIQNGQM